MLAEINLLPQREKRSIAMLVIAIVGIVVLLGSYSYLYFYYSSTKETLAQEQEFLQQMEQIRQLEQAKLEALQGSTAAKKLEGIVAWVENVPLPTVALLQSVTSLLPERGYFVSFAYKEEGKIQCKVQFDAIREVSSYLHQLSASPLVAQAWLSNVKTEDAPGASGEWAGQPLPRYVAEFDLVIQPEEVATLKGAE